MKLVLAIVNNDDSAVVSAAVTRAGYFVTKLATTGGFLMTGNTTFLIGVDDEKAEDVIRIIRDKSKRRTQLVPSNSVINYDSAAAPAEVTIGGATIFVMHVERFEKV